MFLTNKHLRKPFLVSDALLLYVKPITSDYRLFVPIVFRSLGEEKLFDMVDKARGELKLGEQEAAWMEACKYIVAWAEEEIDKYIAQK